MSARKFVPALALFTGVLFTIRAPYRALPPVQYHYNPNDRNAEVEGVKESFAGPVFATADLEQYCLEATLRRCDRPR
jgi:hypothetical protein